MLTADDNVHKLELNASLDGQITAVTLYPNRGEVTRTFRLQLEAGSTEVHIATGFPSVIDTQTLRVEKPEDISLSNVKTLWDSSATGSHSYEKIDALYDKKSLVDKSLARCRRMATALEACLEPSIGKESRRMNPLDIGRFLDSYEEAGMKWDERIQKLEKEAQEIQDKIWEEEDADGAPASTPESPKYSRIRVSFRLCTDEHKTAEIRVIYGVTGVSWYSRYAVSAYTNAQNNGQTVALLYEALVTNETGESWDNVDFTLGTAPSSQSSARLSQWKLSFQFAPSADSDGNSIHPPPKTLTGTTISIPNKVSVPNKTHSRAFKIARIELNPALSWVCTPRINTCVHLKSKVINNSELPMRPGNAGVYLDGNFVFDQYIGATNIGDTLDVSFGVDSNINVIYHPLVRKAITSDLSGFANKPVMIYSCLQRITVVNLRDTTISSLTIIDGIPVPEVPGISVKLMRPPLKHSTTQLSGFTSEMLQIGDGIPITDGIPGTCKVLARWDTVDEPVYDGTQSGKNGKINWVCSIGGREEINLNLEWQVLVFSNKQIKGL